MEIAIDDVLRVDILETVYKLKRKVFNMVEEIEQLTIVKDDTLKISTFTKFLKNVMDYFVSLWSFL